MNYKVLCVDDDANMLASYQRSLRKQFNIDIAQGGEAALAIMAVGGPYAVILSDMSMPGMNGIQFLSRAREVAPQSVRMMLTGNADLATAMDALNCGSIFRFMLKPCLPENLAVSLLAGIEQFKLVHAERELLEKTLQGSVRMLMEILAVVNPEVFGRAQTLRAQMRTLAEALGLGGIWKLELAALLSQIGMVTLPTTVLRKLQTRQTLTDAEALLAQRVPEIGHNLIVKIPRLEPVAEAVRYARKRFDGGGTPDDDLAGEEIPVGARLLRVLADLAEIQASGRSALQCVRHDAAAGGRLRPENPGNGAVLFCPGAQVRPGGLPRRHRHPRRPPLLRPRPRVGPADQRRHPAGPGGPRAHRGLAGARHNFAGLTGLREPIYIEAPAPEARAA